METEIWKPIQGYEGFYEVSSIGRIKSLKYHRWLKKVLLKFSIKKWYCRVTFSKNNESKTYSVSRLVAIHFIPNPLNLPLACHKDETLDENWALYNWEDNLYWWTSKDNAIDKSKKWRHPFKWKFWINHPNSKKIDQYTKDWVFVKTWDSQSDVFLELWICNSSISEVCLWKWKTAGWFVWRFNN